MHHSVWRSLADLVPRSVWRSLADLVPHGYGLADADWLRRHRLLLVVLAAHVPALGAFGLFLGRPPVAVLLAMVVPATCWLLGRVVQWHRQVASVSVTAGLVYSSAALVGLTGGTIEAHFHFFIIIGFIALYQDWVPFLFNVLFTVISHGVGSTWQQTLIFNHGPGQDNPWLWSLIHGVAVLLACSGMAVFWRITEDSQREKDALQRQLAESEINRRRFVSDMLVNLARRNQSMLYRQLEIINQLEEAEQDPDQLSELFKLDHLATRVQRNAESLLVLSGEQPARVWSDPVPVRDVIRAAIAETEDLDRVSVLIDERPAIAGHCVTDVTHLLAELTENAVRFSPPDSVVRIRMRPDRKHPGGQVLVIEDWGLGMSIEDLGEANTILAEAPDVDLAASQRLGFHVVARLGARHGIRVSLAPTPGSGTTAVVTLPPELFERAPEVVPEVVAARSRAFRAVSNPEPGGGAHHARFAPDDTWPGGLVAPEVVNTDPVVPVQRIHSVAGDGAEQPTELRRRVPQSNLVPELRTPASSSPGRAALPPGHVVEAAEAVSRFHAGRRPTQDQPDDGADERLGDEPRAGISTWFEPVVPALSETGPDPDTGPSVTRAEW
jgi:signal transduction histidine kinase